MRSEPLQRMLLGKMGGVAWLPERLRERGVGSALPAAPWGLRPPAHCWDWSQLVDPGEVRQLWLDFSFLL